MKLRVALAQVPVVRDIRSNLETLLRALDVARSRSADILLTPEGSLSGYTHEFGDRETRRALARLVKEARRACVGLALGTCYLEDDGTRCNELRFYDREGRLLGFHTKTLTCGTLDDPPRGEIEHFQVHPLRTFDFHGIRIGGLVCNDLWANPCCTPMPDPHLSQQLSKMGARIVFHAVNGGRADGPFTEGVHRSFHEANLRMRAYAGRLWIASVDNCHPLDSPITSPGGIVNPRGEWVVQLPIKGEMVAVQEIDVL